ncbi:protein archease isoform X1 [Agelaius tricolor]|uniref:protein archease isoform X1 n=1 Tax=Agelaius tricolor TaxID=9191 RepID=UPI0039F1C5EE
MTGRPSGPAPARPLAAPPRSPYAVPTAGGASRASRRRPRRPYRAFTFLVRHGGAAGRSAGRAGRGGRAVPALPAPTPPAAAPSIVSCPRCVRLPAPRTPSRANAAQSAPAAGRRRPIGGEQGGGDGSARGGHVGGLPAGAAIFRSAPGALLKGPRPALRPAGSRFGPGSRSRSPVWKNRWLRLLRSPQTWAERIGAGADKSIQCRG